MNMSKEQAATLINAAISKAQELQSKSAGEYAAELVGGAESSIDLQSTLQKTTMLLGFSKVLLLLAEVNDTFQKLVETGVAIGTPDEALEFVSELNDNELVEILIPLSLFILPTEEIDDLLDK